MLTKSRFVYFQFDTLFGFLTNHKLFLFCTIFPYGRLQLKNFVVYYILKLCMRYGNEFQAVCPLSSGA